MEISPGWVSAGATVIGLVGGVLIRWVFTTMKEQKDDIVAAVNNLRETCKDLYGKYDDLSDELQEYKLHAAETYVSVNALEKMFTRIELRLESIEKDLRERK